MAEKGLKSMGGLRGFLGSGARSLRDKDCRGFRGLGSMVLGFIGGLKSKGLGVLRARIHSFIIRLSLWK